MKSHPSLVKAGPTGESRSISKSHLESKYCKCLMLKCLVPLKCFPLVSAFQFKQFGRIFRLGPGLVNEVVTYFRCPFA